MTAYDDLIAAFPRLGERYFPPLVYRERAAYVLANVTNDPHITPEETEALRAYAGDRPPGPHYDYAYCEDCVMVVGHERHYHCTACLRQGARNAWRAANPNEPLPMRSTYAHMRSPMEPSLEPMCEHCAQCKDHCDCNQCDCCNNWNDDCSCSSCERCGERFDPSEGGCADCNRCDRHRTCNYCDHCNQCSNSYCTDCDRCLDCCDCDSDDEQETFREYHATEGMAFACKRMVGVEWEFNDTPDERNAKPRAWANEWGGSVHPDGSCGWEAVTPPVAGDYIAKCLTGLGAALNDAGVDSRCGIHVHVDASDYTWTDMRRLLLLYARIEPVLYALGGAWRARNTYCMPCGAKYAIALESSSHMSDANKVSMTAVALNSDESRAKSELARGIHKKNGGRYKGLNVVPWLAARKSKRQDTTVEFRMHENSKSAPRIIGWAQLCVTIVEWVKSHEASDVTRITKLAPLDALIAVAPGCTDWIRETLSIVHRGDNLSTVSQSMEWVS